VAIAQAGGIAPLVALTRSGSAGAQEKAAGALWILARDADNKVAIAQAGGIAPLVALTRSGSAGAQENAAAALMVLAHGNDDNRVAIAQAGGIAPLVALTRSGSTGAQGSAAGALMYLALNDDNKVAIAQAGGIAPLVALTRSGSAVAQEVAAGALWVLAFNDDNKVAIAQAGGIAPLVALTRSGSAGAREKAAAALRVLAINGDTSVAIPNAGGIATLGALTRSDFYVLLLISILIGLCAFLCCVRSRVSTEIPHNVVEPLLPAGRARSDAAAAEWAAAEMAPAEKAVAERAAAERLAAERATVQRPAERAGAEKAVAERAAADEAAAAELRRRAEGLGLLKALTDVNVADDAKLKKAIAWCDERGVTSVSEMVEYEMVDDFVDHLGLKLIPGKRLRSMLQAPTSRPAAQTSNRPSSSSSRPLPETPWDIGSWFGRPAAESTKAAENRAIIAIEEDGFALRPVSDARLLLSLEALLQTEHREWLGKGRDVSNYYGPYDSLKLACAWKVDHPRNLDKYTGGVKRVQEELELLERKGKNVSYVPGLPVKTARARGFTLSQACNEVILLHGTNPDRLLALLSTGLNERYSGTGAGTAFGDGVYLAEDVGKTDQYVSADSAYDPSSELHKRLYGRTVRHPDDVFYVLVVRAALGFPVRTQQTGQRATSMDTREKIFPINFRELSAVPGVTPPICHHSLIAELGQVIDRYREFVLFHSDYVHIDYVLAYHRYNGGQKLRTTDSPYQV